jgi:transketolase
MVNTLELEEKANELRTRVVHICSKSGGHISSAFSCIEIMVGLYYSGILMMDAHNPNWDERDRFILSKGHGETALYAILADLGFFPEEWIDKRYRLGDHFLGGHPDQHTPGIEVTSGALGHGLGLAAGISLAAKMDSKKHLQFVLLGDAECTEGSIWEAAIFASKHCLNNLVAIVDRNQIGALDFTDNFTSLEPLADKWRAFGWEVCVLDGHNLEQLVEALNYTRSRIDQRPMVIIAHTIKGKGVSFMENDPAWHTRTLSNIDDVQQALKELEGNTR